MMVSRSNPLGKTQLETSFYSFITFSVCVQTSYWHQ